MESSHQHIHYPMAVVWHLPWRIFTLLPNERCRGYWCIARLTVTACVILFEGPTRVFHRSMFPSCIHERKKKNSKKTECSSSRIVQNIIVFCLLHFVSFHCTYFILFLLRRCLFVAQEMLKAPRVASVRKRPTAVCVCVCVGSPGGRGRRGTEDGDIWLFRGLGFWSVDRIIGRPTSTRIHKYIHPRFIFTCSYLLLEKMQIYKTVHLVFGSVI